MNVLFPFRVILLIACYFTLELSSSYALHPTCREGHLPRHSWTDVQLAFKSHSSLEEKGQTPKNSHKLFYIFKDDADYNLYLSFQRGKEAVRYQLRNKGNRMGGECYYQILNPKSGSVMKEFKGPVVRANRIISNELNRPLDTQQIIKGKKKRENAPQSSGIFPKISSIARHQRFNCGKQTQVSYHPQLPFISNNHASVSKLLTKLDKLYGPYQSSPFREADLVKLFDKVHRLKGALKRFFGDEGSGPGSKKVVLKKIDLNGKSLPLLAFGANYKDMYLDLSAKFKLGEGGFKEVGKVINLKNGKLYAHLRKFKERDSEDEDFIELFNDEEGFAPILTYGRNKKGANQRMSLIQKIYPGTLKNAKKLFQDPEKFNPLVETMIEALATLHSRHWYHRDIKPDNILIDPSLKPEISDFDLVTRFSLNIAGSTSYLHPEAMVRAFELSHLMREYASQKYMPAADLYALGVSLLGVAHPDLADNLKAINNKVFKELRGPGRVNHIQKNKEEFQSVLEKTHSWLLGPEGPGRMGEILVDLLQEEPLSIPSATDLSKKIWKTRNELTHRR